MPPRGLHEIQTRRAAVELLLKEEFYRLQRFSSAT
jgi:hypothetical protein